MSKLVRKINNLLRNTFGKKASFKELAKQAHIYLYAGDVPQTLKYRKFTGLSLSQSNSQHIKHDVTKALPLRDSCVDIYQSEDVFEHIELEKIPPIINEIHRVLKTGGVFRLSMPDYRCDLLLERTLKDNQGNLLFDPSGGGDYVDGKVVNIGHVWFPIYESVKDLIGTSLFTDVTFYHYYDESGTPVTKPIDYSVGYIQRTPDNDIRVQEPYRPMSIVLDCRKTNA